MIPHPFRRSFALLLCACLGLSACTRLQVIDRPQPPLIQQRIETGRDVDLRLRDGRRLRLNVTEVDAQGLSGRRIDGGIERVESAQIERIEFRSFSAARTTGLVLAIVGLLALAIRQAGKNLADGIGDAFEDGFTAGGTPR